MEFLNLILTSKCNWACDYCDFPTLKSDQKKDALPENIETFLPKMLKLLRPQGLSIMGGELGLIENTSIDTTLEIYSRYCIENNTKGRVAFFTNGTFVERNKINYIRIFKNIDFIYCIHVKDSNLNKEYIYPKNIPIEKVVPTVVVRKDNIKSVKEFLRINKDKITHIEMYIEKRKDKSNIYMLTREDFLDIYNFVRKNNINGGLYETITLNNIFVPENKVQEKIDYCSKHLNNISIDMVRMKILKCCSYAIDDNYPELTMENFIKYVINRNEILDTETCRNCKIFNTTEKYPQGMYLKRDENLHEFLRDFIYGI